MYLHAHIVILVGGNQTRKHMPALLSLPPISLSLPLDPPAPARRDMKAAPKLSSSSDLSSCTAYRNCGGNEPASKGEALYLPSSILTPAWWGQQ